MMESMSFTYCRCGEPVPGRSGVPCPNCGLVFGAPSFRALWTVLALAALFVVAVLLVALLA
jgi:hypothetical protein